MLITFIITYENKKNLQFFHTVSTLQVQRAHNWTKVQKFPFEIINLLTAFMKFLAQLKIKSLFLRIKNLNFKRFYVKI